MTVEGEPVVKVSFDESEVVEERICEGILDSTVLGELVGIEVLFLRDQLKASPPKESRMGLPRWSYDPEVDAFYVHLSEERSQEQSKITVRAGINSLGVVVQLSVA